MTNEEITTQVLSLCKDIPELYDLRITTTTRFGLRNPKPETVTRVVVECGVYGDNVVEEYIHPTTQEQSLKQLEQKLEMVKVSPLVAILSKAPQI